jgi:hypothetical protein
MYFVSYIIIYIMIYIYHYISCVNHPAAQKRMWICSVSVSLATVQRDDHPEQDDRIIRIRTGGRIICCSHFWTNHIIQLWDDNHIIELSYHNGIIYHFIISYHIGYVKWGIPTAKWPEIPRPTSHWEALKSARLWNDHPITIKITGL